MLQDVTALIKTGDITSVFSTCDAVASWKVFFIHKHEVSEGNYSGEKLLRFCVATPRIRENMFFPVKFF